MSSNTKTREQLLAEMEVRLKKEHEEYLARKAEMADELAEIDAKFDNMTEEDFAEYMKELDRESEELDRQWKEDTKKALAEGRSIGMIDSPRYGVLGYLKRKGVIEE